MKIKRSYILAVVIALIIGAWILSGQLPREADGPLADASLTETQTDTAAEEVPVSQETEDFAVRVAKLSAEPRVTEIVIRGRTEADRRVTVRSETQGTIIDLPVEKGERVKRGQTLCRLSINAREAEHEQAKALLRQRELELDVARKLAAKGHRSATAVAGAQAAYDAALAAVQQTDVEIERTTIVAPFSGILETRPTELGAYLSTGGECARIVDLDPLLVVGQISEDQVGELSLGAQGTARLVTGETIPGKISYVASDADEQTRTFRVEMEIPNQDYRLRSGITAEIVVPGEEILAHRIPSSVLALDDHGTIGVRTIDQNGTVAFREIDIMADTPEGLWVRGLPEQVTVITVGQDYVSEGQKVSYSLDSQLGS